MMERKAFLLSLGISLLAMFLVYQYVSQEEKNLQDLYGRANMRPVVISTKDILQYETIQETDVDTILVPKAMLPPHLIERTDYVVGAIAAVPIAKGEFVLDNKIISKNVYSGLNTQIAIGKRAISVPVNVRSSVAYHLRPGSRVDLAANFDYKSEKANISEVKIFLQDILVLAVGKTIQESPPLGVDQELLMNIREFGNASISEAKEVLDSAKYDTIYSTITLEVTPIQAQIIVYVLAVYADSITCLLRHVNDRKIARVPTINLYDVMGEDSYLVKGNKLPPPKALPRPKFWDLVGDRQVPVY